MIVQVVLKDKDITKAGVGRLIVKAVADNYEIEFQCLTREKEVVAKSDLEIIHFFGMKEMPINLVSGDDFVQNVKAQGEAEISFTHQKLSDGKEYSYCDYRSDGGGAGRISNPYLVIIN